MKRYVIKQSKTSQLMVFVGCGMAAILAASMFTIPIENGIFDIVGYRVVPVVGVGLFGAAALMSYKKVINPRSLAIIDKSGVRDNTTIGGAEAIAWEDVEDIDTFVATVGSKKVTKLTIKVKDYDGYLAKIKNDGRVQEIQTDAVLKRGVLSIDISSHGSDPKEVYEMAKGYLELAKSGVTEKIEAPADDEK